MYEYDVDEWLRGGMKKPKSKRAPGGLLVIAVGVFPSPRTGESLLDEGEARPCNRLYIGSIRIRVVVGGGFVAKGYFSGEALGIGIVADLRLLSMLATYRL